MKLIIGNRTFDISEIQNVIGSENGKCVVIEYQTGYPEIIDCTQIVDDLKLAEKLATYIIGYIEHAKRSDLLSRFRVTFGLN